MGDTDGEDQERYQHRIRIETEAEGVQQTELPDHCDQRGYDHRDGALEATGEPQQQRQGDADGNDEEQRDAQQAIDQIADLLGEANDVDVYIRVLRLVLVADLLFQLMGEFLVIEGDLLATVVRVRVGLHQRHVDDARLEVVRHQTPDLPGLENIATQVVEAFRRAVIGLRNDLATSEALLRHLGPANAGAPQRLHIGAVDALNIEDFVMDLTQRLHVLLGEYVAILRRHGDPHGIAQVGQIIAMLEHVLNVGMPQRDHLFETGRRTNLGRLVKQEHANQQTGQDHCRSVIENQALEKRRRLLLMLGHVGSGLLLFYGQVRATWRNDPDAALPDEDQIAIGVGDNAGQRAPIRAAE